MQPKKSIFDKTSALRRSFEMTKMAMQVGLKEIQSSSVKSRIDQAKIITEVLSQLKGAAMKGGQLLSIDVADYFPPEAAEVLSLLQSSASAYPYETIVQTLQSELGPEKFASLKSLSREPVASASIAQVHKAVFGEHALALKIQHPGVDTSIESDLNILKKIAQTICSLTGRKMDLGPLFLELKSGLEQEVDFNKEAKFLIRYQKNVEPLNTPTLRYVVPQVYQELSTRKVLAMSWEEGVSFNQWLMSRPSMKNREILAHLMLDLYFHEFYNCGLVQTDPNFSNFLVRENGDSLVMVLLDFGATREYSEKFIQKYIQLLIAVDTGDRSLIVKEALDFGLIDPRESEITKDNLVEMMRVAIEPLRISKLDIKKFKYGDKDYAKRSVETATKFTASLKFSPPPHHLIFLHRKLGGIFSALKRMEVELDVTEYWDKMIASQKKID